MGLRIGIDVGGTFTHGVVLRPPGEVIAKAVTPTTHTDQRGVAAGVAETLRLLIAELDKLGIGKSEIELVAHSTTQATNALLEGDVSGVHLMALAPRGERALVRRALGTRLLDVGNGHHIRIWPKLLQDWETATAENFPASVGAALVRPSVADGPGQGRTSAAPTKTSAPLPSNWRRHGWDGDNIPPGFTVSEALPVAVVQPLAGKQELREETVAAHYRACGHGAVCAGEITQVLGLQARARTAIVNAAMLPRMLATADFTEQAVGELLPGVPLQVVRGDGGAMSLLELRRQPVHSLLSGPAAGASAALHRSSLANAVFIEVGGTSTDITLIKDGRVRHRYATVGGQRLLVPALDLRTVAVGGGSMLRADTALFGPRSAHIAGLPYFFQALQKGLTVEGAEKWNITEGKVAYSVARMSDGSLAAFTMTDAWLRDASVDQRSQRAAFLNLDPKAIDWGQFNLLPHSKRAAEITTEMVNLTIMELQDAHGQKSYPMTLVGGGGGGPIILSRLADLLALPEIGVSASDVGLRTQLISDHAVISAIGAALAVTCVSLSKSVASPNAGDIAALTQEVEARLAAQGAERVSTDYEFDPQRQVLTVTGRGNRPYEAEAQARSSEELVRIARAQLAHGAELAWESGSEQLWLGPGGAGRRARQSPKNAGTAASATKSAALPGVVLDKFGRILWQGRLARYFPHGPGQREAVLADVIQQCTAYTDGGPALPGLALISAGRLIPLELGDPALLTEVLRWERLPDSAFGCFIVRA